MPSGISGFNRSLVDSVEPHDSKNKPLFKITSVTDTYMYRFTESYRFFYQLQEHSL